MYDYIKGLLVKKMTGNNSCITVECNNIGYLINTTERTLNSLDTLNTNVKIYISLIHKEDAMSLCGFLTREDRDIFNTLQSVSGVGMKSSLILLNEFSGYELINAVINEDASMISRAKGIGPKLAKKIILELKDKLINLQNKTPIEITQEKNNAVDNSILQEAQAVLLSFGYTQDEIKKAIKYSIQNSEYKTSEDILKISLQYLSSNC